MVFMCALDLLSMLAVFPAFPASILTKIENDSNKSLIGRNGNCVQWDNRQFEIWFWPMCATTLMATNFPVDKWMYGIVFVYFCVYVSLCIERIALLVLFGSLGKVNFLFYYFRSYFLFFFSSFGALDALFVALRIVDRQRDISLLYHCLFHFNVYATNQWKKWTPFFFHFSKNNVIPAEEA